METQYGPCDSIVILDDSDTDIYLAKKSLERSGLRAPLKAFTSCVDLCRYLQDAVRRNHPLPKFLLLDINLGALNGFDVLEKLRGEPGLSERPEIIMFTSSNSPGDRRRARELGVAFRSKPITIEEYVEFFATLADRTG